MCRPSGSRNRFAAAIIGFLLAGLVSASAWAQDPPPLDAPEAASQPAPELTLSGAELEVRVGELPAVTLTLPCSGESLLMVGDIAYVGCGPNGLVLVDVSDAAAPTLVEHRHLDGAVSRVFELDGGVWVQLTRVEARPLDQALVATPPRAPIVVTAAGPTASSPTGEETAEPEPPAEMPEGVVIEAGAGDVVVDFGSDRGVERGDHIELFLHEERSLGGDEVAVEEVLLAVAKVVAVSAGRSSVRLARNEEVSVGALARKSTRELTRSNFIPRRADGLWEVGFTIRPFLALGTLGFGVVSEGRVAYRFEKPLVIRALFQPVGVGLAEAGDILALGGNLVVAYDTRLFEVGAGMGWLSVNDEPGTAFGSADASGVDRGSDGFERITTSLSIVQSVRLGARDGLALLLDNAFVLHEDEFKYGGTSGTLQIPTTERSWLLLQGAGGIAGYWYADLGLRVLFQGNGESGSLFMTATLGAAGLDGEKDSTCPDWAPAGEDCYEDISYGGPAAGFGLEWRL